ncbi:MAG: hypothetical protein IJM50_01535 [Lachnospiraceae bacterium]|nr:hypothetical protein [Lachnospiraceae bacterium]
MKRALTALVLATVLAAGLSSCQSTLGPAIEREEGRKNIREIPYEDLSDEESGFRYPGLPWGITLDEVQERTYQAVTKVSGVDPNGNIVYEAQYLKAMVGGRVNDDAQIATDDEEKLLSVMLVFSSQNAKNTLKQSEVFDLLKEKLSSLYGEPELKKHTDEIMSGLTAEIEDYTWKKAYKENDESRLVLSKGFISYTSEPDYVSLTFTDEDEHE